MNRQVDQKTDKERIVQLENEISQLKKIILNTPGNLFWKDLEGKYLGCNQSVLKIHELGSLSDFIGKTVHDFYDSDHANDIEKKDEFVINNDQTVVIEEVGYDKQGQQSFYLTKKIPMHDNDGKVTGLMGVAIDMGVDLLERQTHKILV